MRYTTTVKLVLAESPSSPIPNVRVALYDRDRFTPDDLLGAAETNADGEARFQYNTEAFADVDEAMGGDMPELYAVVYDARDQVVTSTRSDAEVNLAQKRITIPIAREVALRHQLLPMPNPTAAPAQ